MMQQKRRQELDASYLDLTRWYRSSFSPISSRRWCFWWNWWPWLVRCPLQLRQRRAPCQTTSITVTKGWMLARVSRKIFDPSIANQGELYHARLPWFRLTIHDLSVYMEYSGFFFFFKVYMTSLNRKKERKKKQECSVSTDAIFSLSLSLTMFFTCKEIRVSPILLYDCVA